MLKRTFLDPLRESISAYSLLRKERELNKAREDELDVLLAMLRSSRDLEEALYLLGSRRERLHRKEAEIQMQIDMRTGGELGTGEAYWDSELDELDEERKAAYERDGVAPWDEPTEERRVG